MVFVVFDTHKSSSCGPDHQGHLISKPAGESSLIFASQFKTKQINGTNIMHFTGINIGFNNKDMASDAVLNHFLQAELMSNSTAHFVYSYLPN